MFANSFKIESKMPVCSRVSQVRRIVDAYQPVVNEVEVVTRNAEEALGISAVRKFYALVHPVLALHPWS